MSVDDLLGQLDKRLVSNEKAILKAVNNLENRIVSLLSAIDEKRDGGIVAPSRSLAQARATLRQISRAFFEIYQVNIEEQLASYPGLDLFVEQHYGIEYSAVTKNSLLSLATLERSQAESLTAQTMDRLNESLIDHVINGKSKDDLIDDIRGIVSGSIDRGGRPFATHATTLAQDGLMSYFSTANFMSAKQAGINRFKYYGSAIKTSRQWCRDHIGKTYTTEEIAGFDNDSWAGKKPGSTFINRGGWGCRHSWVGIVD